MKKLNEYLVETARQYIYKVKIAGELSTETYEKFKASLGMFDVADCGKPKSTPIQSDPYGFPGLKNEEINIFDITLDYPANTEQVIQLARLAGIDPAKIVVIGKDFNDSMNAEAEGVEDGTRLETENYPDQTTEQKEASDAYADSYKTAAKEFSNKANTDFEVAGGKEKPAKFNTDKDSGGEKSPLGTLKIKDIIIK